ncbi:MAG: MBL fold metallo-hydrolase [Deltaproteobacteria bacterium]|nr:MBL fold metallo-hydrolase [Deltaproteobacteria bacterium]
MKITVLIENTKKEDKFIEEFGLSFYIEAGDKKILMDTGSSDNFLKNAEIMGINPEYIDYAIISHGHYDHGGGISDVMNINNKARLYIHKKAFGDYYGNIGAKLPFIVNSFTFPFINKSKKFSKYIGLDKKILKKYGRRIEFIEKFTQIDDNIFILTDICKKYPLAAGNKFLLVKKDNELEQDDFIHEIMLVIKEKDRLVLFSGCCHNGILNMIETVKKFKNESIKAVIGGFHLKINPYKNDIAGDVKDIEFIGEGLLKENISEIYTGHCTGDKAYEILSQILKGRIKKLYTGRVIEL